MQFRITKRRKSALDEPIIPTKKILNIKYRVGGYSRKLLRYFFEHKAVKKILGTNIALMLVVSSFMPTLASSEPKVLGTEALAIETNVIKSETPIHTIVAIQNPVKVMKITQGYSFFHPGLDLDGITGDSIEPIKNGTVVYADTEKFGFGKHVIIDHGNGLTTLYAHLSKINVKNGEEVTTDTKLGEMGATGHAFGDHLHFEIRDHGKPINPLTILPR